MSTFHGRPKEKAAVTAAFLCTPVPVSENRYLSVAVFTAVFVLCVLVVLVLILLILVLVLCVLVFVRILCVLVLVIHRFNTFRF